MDAKKDRRGPDEALALLKGAKQLVVAKGKKVVTVDLVKSRPSDEELLALMLGPTGNLRAPAMVKASRVLIGFDEHAYREMLAGR